MMNKKAQTLMISLWILAILVILAVGMGHRVSMALRMSRYQRESLKAWGRALAGLNQMIETLLKDSNEYDALNEDWANFESGLANVKVSCSDAERRININTASREALLALLEQNKIASAAEAVDNILIWRGDAPDEKKAYDELGYSCKAAPFSCIEELQLVKGLALQDYEKLKGAITVAGEGLVNVNTVSEDVLAVLCQGLAAKRGIDASFAESVAAKVVQLRDSRRLFKDKAEIDPVLSGDEEVNIFNGLMEGVSLQSGFFLIEVTANSSKIKRKIEATFNRKEKRISSWHES
jgi:type II secretory pathway component PulK